ncbi:unnamed protein product [Cunninghamella blakesleeana]
MEDTVVQLPHNNLCLELRKDPVKGRGVFSTKAIKYNTLIDISPSYYLIIQNTHNMWKDGYALALGLGSMFNHDNKPNVGFVRDFNNNMIKYIALRDIQPNEELNISYGSNLWFEDANEKDDQQQQISDSDDGDDNWLQNVMMD